MCTLVDCYVHAGGLVMHTLVDWLCTRWWIGYVHAGEYNHSGSVKPAVCTQAGDCNRTVCIMCGPVSKQTVCTKTSQESW